MRSQRISVIVPARNEESELPATLRSVHSATGVEAIVVDGASEDGTVSVARSCGARVLTAPRGRARQMNAGAEAATGALLVFLHADTRLPPDYDGAVRATLARRGVTAGAFRLRIDGDSASLRLIESVANWRAGRLRMPYGDQALFMTSATFAEAGGYPAIPFMEDFELVRRLRRRGRIVVVDGTVITSARRWSRLGAWRTTLINQIAVAAYIAGVTPERIGRWYRRGRLLGPWR